jgi:hypothetical protein
MLVRPLDGYTFSRSGQDAVALAAKNILFFRCFLFSFVFNMNLRGFIVRPARRLTKRMDGV